jgi:hypothetical protein
MKSSILALATRAADRLDLQRPATLFAAYNEGDTSDRKLLDAIHQTCEHLAATYDWQCLQAQTAFDTLAQEMQNGLPLDFKRIVMGTVWNSTLRRPVPGPLDSREIAEAISGAVGRIEPAFYIQGDAIYMRPAPPVDQSIVFTYIRDAVGDMGGVYIGAFSVPEHDAAVALWHDDLVLAGTVLNYLRNAHDSYAQEELTFERIKADHIKRDGGGRRLDMGGGARSADDMVQRLKSSAIIITA